MITWGYSRKPSEEERTVENKQIYEIMEKLKLDEFDFGMLIAINDRQWHDGEGNGTLMEVFSDYAEALKRRKVYDCPIHCDYDDYLTEEAFKINIRKTKDPYKLIIDMSRNTELIFDIFNPAEINKLIPVPAITLPI